MAISARMQALIQKIEAAEAARFAELRERGKAQSDARAKAQEKTLLKNRRNLLLARAARKAALARRAKAKS
jgi:hypothetical protein